MAQSITTDAGECEEDQKQHVVSEQNVAGDQLERQRHEAVDKGQWMEIQMRALRIKDVVGLKGIGLQVDERIFDPPEVPGKSPGAVREEQPTEERAPLGLGGRQRLTTGCGGED